MTIEEEHQFLLQWQDQAAQGGILTVPPIHAALVEKTGHAIPLSTTYRLLARHGWRKVQPDTQHPKSDPLSCWAPSPSRPVVNLALIREFRYEYAAVSPWDGCLDCMTSEKMNTESMTRFLTHPSAKCTKKVYRHGTRRSIISQKQGFGHTGKCCPDAAATLFARIKSDGTDMEHPAPKLFCQQSF